MIGRTALRSALRQAPSARLFSTSAINNRNVAVLGASGGIGQPVSGYPDWMALGINSIGTLLLMPVYIPLTLRLACHSSPFS